MSDLTPKDWSSSCPNVGPDPEGRTEGLVELVSKCRDLTPKESLPDALVELVSKCRT